MPVLVLIPSASHPCRPSSSSWGSSSPILFLSKNVFLCPELVCKSGAEIDTGSDAAAAAPAAADVGDGAVDRVRLVVVLLLLLLLACCAEFSTSVPATCEQTGSVAVGPAAAGLEAALLAGLEDDELEDVEVDVDDDADGDARRSLGPSR